MNDPMISLAYERLPLQPRIIFMGTPEFAVPTLRALIDHGHHVLAVVTQPDRPKGRGQRLASPPVKRLAEEKGIEVLQPVKAWDEHFVRAVREKAPDLILVVAFGQILKKELLLLPRWGVLNIHASLLPKYRGAAPIQWAILNNESVTGLTIMRMDEGLDTGPILFQKEIPILPYETAGQLHDRLGLEAGGFFMEALTHMARHPLRERTQEPSGASYAPKIGKDMALINWSQSAHKVSALIRALDPWPGAYTLCEGREIKLFASRASEKGRTRPVPGRILRQGDTLRVETESGLVEIGELQLPGKKRLPAPDFLRGFPLLEGVILGK